MKEFNIIEKFFKPLTKGCKAARNLADDVASFSLKSDEELVISKDVFVENVHFLPSDDGFKIASKLLRTNLSDLASAGATPLYYMLGFSKNKNFDQKFLSEFARGLKSVQDESKLCLIGGDTVSSREKFFSVTIFGVVKKEKILSRSAAKAGDLIFVSGTIGDAFLGLKLVRDGFEKKQSKLAKDLQQELLNRHFFPTPRLKLGQKLNEKKISKCAIDVSDGLLADLRHVCEASNLSAEIYQDKIPLSVAAKKFLQKHPEIVLTDLFSGGDDYELIFAVSKKNSKQIVKLESELNLGLTCIGEFKKSSGNSTVTLLNSENQKIKIKKFGYEH